MSSEFVERAQREALRYGSDPWVFVRELIQNARDAGAHRVTIVAEERNGLARVAVGDDGAGMSFGHARRFLFALYASSKEGERGAAGRFGVGFWSILRFAPTRIVIRSWTRKGGSWEVELDGALSELVRRAPVERRQSGTEIVLERPADDGALAHRVRDAAWQSARYACRRDAPGRALDVRVNDVPVSEPFELAPPSASFRKGRMRGVVALGSEARVEVFAQGLRVRAAPALQDLLSPEGSSARTRVRFPTLGDGIAPRAILDGDDFEPLLARADVRETAGLRKLVALSREALGRLIERQIDAVRPRSLAQRASRPLFVAACVLGLLGLGWALQRTVSVAAPITAAAVSRSATAADEAAPAFAPYRDLGHGYEGPRVDTLPLHPVPLALRYSPADATLYFAGLRLEDPLAPVPELVDAGRYEGAVCGDGCVDVRVVIDDGPGLLRIPVPTGHRVDPASVALAGRRHEIRRSAGGEPLVVLEARVQDVLSYRTRAAVEPVRPRPSGRPVPPPLAEIVRSLTTLPASEREEAATAWVSARVRYSTSAEVVARYRADAARDILSSALAIGAGDCDVQNAVLASVLQASGASARLAIGYVGSGGLSLGPAHAWVEVQGGDGLWRVADASLGSGPASVQAPLATLPAAPVPTPPRELGVTARPPAPASPASTRGVALGIVATLAALALVRVVTRTQSVLRLAANQDVAALLQGALQRPDAFHDVPALHHRRLVPVLGGRAVSLAEAAGLAAERRLFRSESGSLLARRAAGDGATVLDTAQEEARVVADALGVVDLDEWDAFLRDSRTTALLGAVERSLQALAEACELRVVTKLEAPVVLDLPVRRQLRRVVVLGGEEPWLVSAEAQHPTRPCAALFVAADQVADVLRLDAGDRRRLLRPLARAALREALA